MTKRGELIQVLTLDGLSFHTADDFRIDDNKAIRNRFLYQMASPDVAISFYTIKRKHSHYPEGVYPKAMPMILMSAIKKNYRVKPATRICSTLSCFIKRLDLPRFQ